MSINKAVWLPATLGLLMKIVTGLLGAWAFALVLPDGSARNNSDDILSMILHDETPRVAQYAAYLWDITTLIPGIPVLAIMVRYNLLSGRVCGRFAAFFWGVVAPWIVTMFCYETNVLLQFCNWVAIVVQGYINFVVPALLYRAALLRYGNPEEDDGPEGAGLLGASVNDDEDDSSALYHKARGVVGADGAGRHHRRVDGTDGRQRGAVAHHTVWPRIQVCTQSSP